MKSKTKKDKPDMSKPDNIVIETVHPLPQQGLDISSMINSLPEAELNKIVLKNEKIKKIIEKESIRHANEAEKNQVQIEMSNPVTDKRKRKDKTALIVALPGTGFGNIKAIYKAIPTCDWERFKKRGFVKKVDIDNADIKSMVRMYDNIGNAIDIPQQYVNTMLANGFSMDKKK